MFTWGDFVKSEWEVNLDLVTASQPEDTREGNIFIKKRKECPAERQDGKHVTQSRQAVRIAMWVYQTVIRVSLRA